MKIEFSDVASDSVHCTYILEPLVKTLDTKLSGAFRLVNTVMCQEGDIP